MEKETSSRCSLFPHTSSSTRRLKYGDGHGMPLQCQVAYLTCADNGEHAVSHGRCASAANSCVSCCTVTPPRLLIRSRSPPAAMDASAPSDTVSTRSSDVSNSDFSTRCALQLIIIIFTSSRRPSSHTPLRQAKQPSSGHPSPHSQRQGPIAQTVSGYERSWPTIRQECRHHLFLSLLDRPISDLQKFWT